MDACARNVIFDMGNVLMRFDGPYFSSCFTDTPEDAAAAQLGALWQPAVDAARLGDHQPRDHGALRPRAPARAAAP